MIKSSNLMTFSNKMKTKKNMIHFMFASLGKLVTIEIIVFNVLILKCKEHRSRIEKERLKLKHVNLNIN